METFHLKRFFIQWPEPSRQFPAEFLVEDELVTHHLRTVMRAKVGESVVLVDGARRMAYLASIQEILKRSVRFTVQSRLEVPPNLLPSVTLAVALIKEQRWDWLIQKATELGVEAIQPILSERTVIKLANADISKKLERWETVMRSAAEQSEGLFIPQVLPPISVQGLCESGGGAAWKKVLLAERGENRATLKTALTEGTLTQPIVVAVGPEGGWTDGELQTFQASGYTFVSLGQRIMRSETAAMAAMAAVVYEHGH